MHVYICNMHVTDLNANFSKRHVGKKSHVDMRFFHVNMRFFSQHGEKIPCQHGAPFPDVVEVRPLPAASFARAPGVSCGACSVPPPGVPIVATWACAPPSSVPALSAVFTILDGNRWCVDVSFPDGPPAAPGADFCVCGPPSGPSVSAGEYFFAVVRFCPRSIAPFVPFTSIQ